MTPKKLAKLRKKIASLRNKNGVRSRELKGLARQIGRRPHSRGKEGAWVMVGVDPLSIPDHSREMSRYTVKNILDTLEDDLDRIDEDTEGGDEDVYH